MRNKKLLSIFMVLAFLFSAMGLAFAPSPSLAATVGHGGEEIGGGGTSGSPGDYLDGTAIPPDPDNPDCSTVLRDNTINVKFIIEAGDVYDEDGYATIPDTRFRKELAVVVSADFGEAITVTTLLDTLDNDLTNDLTFYGKSGNNLVPFDADTDYLAAVEVSGASPYPATWEAGSALEFDGWVLRVNDKFLVKVTDDGLGYEGLGILQTALSDGDIVHFFYDMPIEISEEDFAANYVRGVFDGYDGSDPIIQLQGHKTNIHGSDNIMGVDDYADLGEDVSASIYTSDGTTQIGTSVLSDAAGEVAFTGLTPGTYILKTTPTYHPGEDYGWDNAFFVLTGAYTKITIPPAQ
jgi:hypothetical protein